MKYVSKMACLVFLVIVSNLSFGMTRVLMRKPAPPRHYQELSLQRRMIQTKAAPETVKTSATLSDRIQQKLAELKIAGWRAWTNFTNRFSRAPAITISQTIPPKSPAPSSIHLSASIGQSELSATITAEIIQTLQAQALESALKVIKENRKEYDLENEMDGLIVCGYPGPELLVLSKIKLSKQFTEFFINKRKQIFKSIGFSDEAIDSSISEIEQNRKNAFDEFYTQPIATTKRDQNLPEDIIKSTDNILKNCGINPDCVSLMKPTFMMDVLKSRKGVIASARGAYMDEGIIHPAKLTFFSSIRLTKPTIFNRFLATIIHPILIQTFVIAHEIGHLIQNHTGEIEYLEDKLKQQAQNYAMKMQKDNPYIDIDNTADYIFKNILKELGALYELEADATVALLDPEIARSMRQEFLKQIDSLSETELSQPSSDIHSSIGYKDELIRKILQLHALEKIQQKTYLFERIDPTKQ